MDISESDDVIESFSEENEEFNLLENDEVVESLVQEPIKKSSEIQIKQASRAALESKQTEEEVEEYSNKFYVFIGDKRQDIDVIESIQRHCTKCIINRWKT